MSQHTPSHSECSYTTQDHAILHACVNLFADRLPLFHTLLAFYHGSVVDVWHMPHTLLARFGVRSSTAKTLMQRKQAFGILEASRELHEYARRGIFMICRHNTHYPELLAAIAQPPAALYCRGNTPLLSLYGRQTIAIVGARKPSAYGSAVAQQTAERAQALQWCVVSGLALGIDAAAQRAIVDGAGNQRAAATIAVLGSGLSDEHIGPPSNQPLARAIIERGGLLVSEYPFTLPGQPRFFPERNRIIAGLSQVTLVVEAARNSGSLITSRHALEENRDVFAVPGEIYNPLAYGPNSLIAKGATPIISLDDFSAELLSRSDSETKAIHTTTARNKSFDASIAHLTETQQLVLHKGLLHKTASAQRSVIQQRTQLPEDLLSQELVMLEIEGLITRESTGEYRWL